MLKILKIRDNKHLKFIRTLPCVITLKQGETEAAHIRSGNNAGMGLKSGDNCVLPLSGTEHRRQHFTGSEARYWAKYGGLDRANELANALHIMTGDFDACLKLIIRFRKNFANV